MNISGNAAHGGARAVVLLDDPRPLRADDADTLVQAEAVEAALTRLGFDCSRVYLSPSIAAATEALVGHSPALVFNLVESISGVGRHLHLAPALVEALGFALTGAGSVAMATSTDKLIAKRILRGAGLATPEWHTRTPAADGERWIVKPVDEDASLGIGPQNVSRDTRALARLVAERQREQGGRWFYERFVEGREFNISLLESGAGFRVLPIAEIRFDAFEPGRPRIVDFAAKWDPDAWTYENTPRHFDHDPKDVALLEALEKLALRSVSQFGLRGYARVDVRVDGAGRPWVLEVNANPCLAPDAGFTAAAARAGLDFQQVVESIVHCACEPTPSRSAA